MHGMSESCHMDQRFSGGMFPYEVYVVVEAVVIRKPHGYAVILALSIDGSIKPGIRQRSKAMLLMTPTCDG